MLITWTVSDLSAASRAEAWGRRTAQHAVVPPGNERDRFFGYDGWHRQAQLGDGSIDSGEDHRQGLWP
jgi:hypothetical protein